MIIAGINFDTILDVEKEILMNTIDAKFERSKAKDRLSFAVRMDMHQIVDETYDALRSAKDMNDLVVAGLKMMHDVRELKTRASAPIIELGGVPRNEIDGELYFLKSGAMLKPPPGAAVIPINVS